MRKINKKLTADQIKRGVVYSSTLSTERTEQTGDTTHEVFKLDTEGYKEIAHLQDDKFFNKSHWNYNIIRCGQ